MSAKLPAMEVQQQLQPNQPAFTDPLRSAAYQPQPGSRPPETLMDDGPRGDHSHDLHDQPQQPTVPHDQGSPAPGAPLDQTVHNTAPAATAAMYTQRGREENGRSHQSSSTDLSFSARAGLAPGLSRFSMPSLKQQPPQEWLCPISWELMLYPCTLVQTKQVCYSSYRWAPFCLCQQCTMGLLPLMTIVTYF